MRLTRPDLTGTLRSVVDGSVLTSDDPGYDESRTPFFRHRIGRPAAVVRPRHAAAVAATVSVAANSGTPLQVRGGGHTAHSTGEGLLLDVRSLTGIDLELSDHTAWVGSGHTAGTLTDALGRHGTAVGFGDTPSTAISGLTLGGGVGFLARRHGLTIDNLLAAEIVTAEGQTRLVDPAHDADLFWAIRGGGGNFGVVTRFRYRLARVAEVYGGLLVLSATPRIIAEVAGVCAGADRELTVIVNILPAPPLPGIPPEQVGRPVLMARVCHTDPAVAEAAVRPLRRVATPLLDQLQPMPYPALLEETPDRGTRPALQTLFVNRIDETAGAAILGHLAEARSPLRLVQFRVLGGAIGDRPADETAYAHRDAPVLVMIVHGDEPGLGWADRWARQVRADLDQGVAGAYVNFLGPGDDRIQAAYPGPTFARLRAVKTAYDPQNLFRHNLNITPEGLAA
ncbi:FAD-binding oxidoreductase [Microlunatus phosphovorus]|nr:FAD-binding oxidoreductase [Microlunatus phosphovorus]